VDAQLRHFTEEWYTLRRGTPRGNGQRLARRAARRHIR
jgi:hypothetical protein